MKEYSTLQLEGRCSAWILRWAMHPPNTKRPFSAGWDLNQNRTSQAILGNLTIPTMKFPITALLMGFMSINRAMADFDVRRYCLLYLFLVARLPITNRSASWLLFCAFIVRMEIVFFGTQIWASGCRNGVSTLTSFRAATWLVKILNR